MKAIVLGATGLVGSELLTCLAVESHIEQVVAISRRPISEIPPKVDNRVIDFKRLDEFVDAFAGDVLFSCLGSTLKQAGSIAAQRVVDFDYQYQAAKLAKAAGVKHYVLVSSSGANAGSLSPYLSMKGELEQAVLALDFDKTSIVQPSLLLGPREKKRTAEGFGGVVLPLLCRLPGLKRYRPIQGSQVAQKMVQISLIQEAKVQTYTLDQVFPSVE